MQPARVPSETCHLYDFKLARILQIVIVAPSHIWTLDEGGHCAHSDHALPVV